jgi:FkbM family methyltransferase
MSDIPFVSYAQNAEDVVLWRALGHIKEGRYVDVGANHPRTDSVSRAFYERGWRGITVEPLGDFVALHRAERPRDIQVQAAAAEADSDALTLHSVPGTGLSTIVTEVDERNRLDGWAVEDIEVEARTLSRILGDAGDDFDEIHFMVIDLEGAEGQALSGLDLQRWRPWVLVVEATRPNSMVPTQENSLIEAGYSFCLFDGLSRFYVAAEHRESLEASLSFPAGVLDHYIPLTQEQLQRDIEQSQRDVEHLQDQLDNAERQVTRWRHKALVEWAEIAAAATADSERIARELEGLHGSLSWRVTEPLRSARRMIGRVL